MKFFKFVYTIDLTIIMSIRLSRNERGGFFVWGRVCGTKGMGATKRFIEDDILLEALC